RDLKEALRSENKSTSFLPTSILFGECVSYHDGSHPAVGVTLTNAAHRLRVKAGTLQSDEIVEPVLAQQLIQLPIKRIACGRGKSVAVTHASGCRSRLRSP